MLEAEVGLGHVIEGGGGGGVIGDKGLEEESKAKEGLHGLDGSVERDVHDSLDALFGEIVAVVPTLIAEEGDFLETKPRFGELEEEVLFLAASEELFELRVGIIVVVGEDKKVVEENYGPLGEIGKHVFDVLLKNSGGGADTFGHEFRAKLAEGSDETKTLGSFESKTELMEGIGHV